MHPSLRVITVVYLASRIVTLGAAWAVTILQPAHPQHSKAIPAPRSIAQVLSTWDGNWYLKVAFHGYPSVAPPGNFYAHTGVNVQNGLGFFPLYSMLIRAASWVSPFSHQVTAELLAMVFGFVATLLVWKLASDIFDPDTGRRAALLFCTFPGAFVLSWAYSEALLVMLAAACLWWLRKERWVLAGVAALLAGATRATGALLIVCCAWSAVEALRKRRDWKALAAPVLSPLGIVAFFGYLKVHTGSWNTWFDVEKRGWGHRNDWGWANLKTVGQFLTHPNTGLSTRNLNGHNIPFKDTVGLATLVAFGLLALVVFHRRSRLPAPLLIYAVGTIGLSFTSAEVQLNPRFVFTAFPLLIGFARPIRDSWMQVLLLLGCSAMAVLTVLYGMRTFNPLLYP
jgi:hypothetical protein